MSPAVSIAHRAPATTPSVEALLADHGDAVLRLAYAMLRDRAAAEDALQDVFVRALHRGSTLRDPDAVRSWLLTITANRCRDELRSWARRNVSPVADVPERGVPGAGDVDPEVDPDLARAVLGLALPLREVIVLHYYFELPVARIADVVGVSPVTVRTRLHRARTALRRALEKETNDV